MKMTCLRGTLLDGRCIAPGPSCPPEYEQRRESCVRRETTSLSCPAGGNLQNDYCVIGRPECEDGYRYEHGTCRKTIRVSAQCRGSAVLKDGMCVTKVTTSKPYCSQGYTLQGSSCVRIVYAKASCTTISSASPPYTYISGTINSSNNTIVPGAPSIAPTVEHSISLYPSYVSVDSSTSVIKEVVPSVAQGGTYTGAGYVQETEANFDDYFTGERDSTRYEDFPIYSSTGEEINVVRDVDEHEEYPSYSNSVKDTTVRHEVIEKEYFPSYNTNTDEKLSTLEYEMHEVTKDKERTTKTSVERVKRCTVIGPRVCTYTDDESWSCEQKEYENIASSYCETESTTIQLTAQHHMAFNETFIVMAPPEQEEEKEYGYDEEDNEEDEEATIDCSDCADQSYSCSTRCYTYEECSSCNTITLSSFCQSSEPILYSLLLACLLQATDVVSKSTTMNKTVPVILTSATIVSGTISEDEILANETGHNGRAHMNETITKEEALVNEMIGNGTTLVNGTVVSGIFENSIRVKRQIAPLYRGNVSDAGLSTVICPAGSVLQNGQCIMRISFCGAGYTLVGNACVGQATCQKGYKLVNGQCHLENPCATKMCGNPPPSAAATPPPP
uniref:Uncharacterized protein n=1 Tax=Anopheles epiroticus TaxID=199890 RepID=A0A182NZU8_9DIPT